VEVGVEGQRPRDRCGMCCGKRHDDGHGLADRTDLVNVKVNIEITHGDN